MYIKTYIKNLSNILLNTPHSMSISLIPYLFIFIYNILYYNLSFYLFIPLIVFVNGLIYHSFFQNKKYILYYDTITNIILISYTTYLTYKLDYTDRITHYIVLVYVIIMFSLSHKVKSYFIHIVCVQLMLLEVYIRESKVHLIP